MSNNETKSLEDFFEDREPTHEAIMHELRTNGEFVGFAIGKLLDQQPDFLTSGTGDGISIQEARRRIEDGTL